jgi:hypothetical protein
MFFHYLPFALLPSAFAIVSCGDARPCAPENDGGTLLQTAAVVEKTTQK